MMIYIGIFIITAVIWYAIYNAYKYDKSMKVIFKEAKEYNMELEQLIKDYKNKIEKLNKILEFAEKEENNENP